MDATNVPLIGEKWSQEKAEQFKLKLLMTLDRMQRDLNCERHEMAVLLAPETMPWLGRETSAWGPVVFLARKQINKGKVYVMRVVDIPAELRAAP